jgi:predicted nucleotidyltransferase
MPPRDFACLHLQPQHWALLRDLLARHMPQAEAWAYGSRVDGTAHDTSDLDVVLRNPADLSQDLPGWDDLKEAIQNSRLPILVDLHLWSRLPQSFHANIEAAYVVLQTGQGNEDQSAKR